ncbi:MAG: T9SS type A sorting domain-containing protein, partial [Chitinophagales bacterium]
MPHRAYGSGITLSGSGDAASKAFQFIKTEMASFNINTDQLKLRSSHASPKYNYVDYYQTYQGIEVLNSRVTVRSTKDDRVVLIGADVFNDIQLNISPSLSADIISSYAIDGMGYEITGIAVNPDVKVLPIPVGDLYAYRLVYEVTVSCKNFEGYPARYYTQVDANNGEVLYRSNQICNFDDELIVNATVADPNPWEPNVIRGLPDLKVTIAGTDYYTDSTGTLLLGTIALPVNSTINLVGKWSTVVSGNTSVATTSFTNNLIAGLNLVSFDTHATIEKRSAYYHVNVVHNFLKFHLPEYEEMDETLITRVERTDGSCNAFYDGSSINFYQQGGGCYDLALAGDVVYHEYGHGIDMRFYDFYSNGLDNGAMNEGYSDVWGIGITDNPILGLGFSDTNPEGYVRRYDINKKVYPQDIQGEVHADGEIIAGCWYDTRLNIGNKDTMFNLFAETLFGLADGPQGQEGTVYRDVLLDALAADDNDGNLNNGTPHDLAILSAFALHGISLIGDLNLIHAEPLVTFSATPITIKATINTDFPIYLGDAFLHYKLNTATDYQTVPMTLLSGSNYEGLVPAQPQGSILDYYFTVTDIYGSVALTQPSKILQADPNLPYKLLIGYDQLIKEDFEIYFGDWIALDPSDDAATGAWTFDEPVGSFLVPGDPNSMVQTDKDHTDDNTFNFCAFTGNASAGSGAGTNDCDAGKNTLYGPKYDVTSYQNPAISYYRWYSNDQGANPGNDLWKVHITNGNGVWVPVELTYTADHQWRGNAFRIKDYVELTDKVQLRFVASDSIIAGADLEGGSLVEAAVDDVILWELGEPTIGIHELENIAITVAPNPVSDVVMLKWNAVTSGVTKVEMLNTLGRSVYQHTINGSVNQLSVPVDQFPAGIYTLHINSDKFTGSKKLVVQ